jgi:hypothetical protein
VRSRKRPGARVHSVVAFMCLYLMSDGASSYIIIHHRLNLNFLTFVVKLCLQAKPSLKPGRQMFDLLVMFVDAYSCSVASGTPTSRTSELPVLATLAEHTQLRLWTGHCLCTYQLD